MFRILRQLTPDELRRVAMHCNARPGAAPEEIIRALSRLCGATLLGLFPAATDEALLDHVGRRLGMEPHTSGPRGVPARERAIFACYLRQAWSVADPDRQREVLKHALQAWDNPLLPRPEMVEGTLSGTPQAVLEAMLHHATGCRALAVATESAPLPLPAPEGPVSAVRLPFGYGPTGHQALYAVLRVLWSARARLLHERRTQRLQLERQIRQLETMLAVRRQNSDAQRTPWPLNPASGMSLTAAAGVSAAVHLVLAANPVTLIPTVVVGVAGLAWSASAAAMKPRTPASERVIHVQAQIATFRAQLQNVEREVNDLEAE